MQNEIKGLAIDKLKVQAADCMRGVYIGLISSHLTILSELRALRTCEATQFAVAAIN